MSSKRIPFQGLLLILVFTFALSPQAKEVSLKIQSFVQKGWSYQAPSGDPLFSHPSKDFQGTLTYKELPSLFIFQAEYQFTPKELTQWLNKRYLKGKATSLRSLPLRKGKNTLYVNVFQAVIQGDTQIIMMFSQFQNHQVMMLSQNSNLDSYKKDLNEVLPLLKKAFSN